MGINAEFILYGDDCPIFDIADELGIPNPIIESKGLIRRIGSAKNDDKKIDCTSLVYESGCVDDIDVDVPLNIIYNNISPKANKIKECISKYQLTAKFVIVINLTENPIIALPEKIIHLASEFCAEVEFDSYIHQKSKFFWWRH